MKQHFRAWQRAILQRKLSEMQYNAYLQKRAFLGFKAYKEWKEMKARLFEEG